MPIDENTLTRIYIEDPTFTEISLRYGQLTLDDIKKLTSVLEFNSFVTHLDLTGNLLGDECVELITKCNYLRSLNLSGNRITDTNLHFFAANSTLLALDLSYNNITDQGIEELAKNNSIMTLLLNGNSITLANKLAQNKQLVTLSLMSNEIYAEGVKKFVANTTLRKLLLDDNLLRDEGASFLAQNTHLEELSLSHNLIGDKGAVELAQAKNPYLMTLCLAHNQIGDVGAAAFKKNSTIKKLNLAENQINSAGIAEIVKNSTVTWLDLSYNQIDDASLSNFPKNKVITHLSLGHNHITAVGVEFLVQMSQLVYLILPYNSIGDEGAVRLASIELTYLDLTGNNIGFEGAGALAENLHLKTLVLSFNNVGDPGAMLLARNSTLQELILCYNNVGNAGAMALAKNSTLQILKLNNNQINHKGKTALQANSSFTQLSLSRETALEYTTDRFQLIYSFTQNLFCILGVDGKIYFCNPALMRLLGYRDDELLDSNLLDLFHPIDKMENHLLKRLNQKFPATSIDDRFLCKNGSHRILRWNSQLMGGYVYAACTDVTDYKKAQREALRLQRQKEVELIRREEAENYNRQQTEFIANLSHEIRNPLSGAYSIVELMEEDVDQVANDLQYMTIETIQQKLKRMSVNLQDLKKCIKYPQDILNANLDIARISEKKLILDEKPLPFNKTVVEAIKILQAQITQKGLTLQVGELAHEMWVKGDASRIKQIIINLVSNAVKFTPQGDIKINIMVLGELENSVHFGIKVIDTGIGMTGEEVGRLFRRYSQTQTNNAYGGTGLGLYISKKIAELMDGDIIVESQKNQGTIFTFDLYCKKMKPEEKHYFQAAAPSSPSMLFRYQAPNKPTVLVVEDNPINRRIFCELLQKEFCCIEAENGQQAVEQFKQHPCDLILMDVCMPVMNGLEATKNIRQFEKEKETKETEIPIIALTANALERDEDKAKEAGVNAYLIKPCKKDVLIKTIHSLLHKAINIERQVSQVEATTKCMPASKKH